MAVLESTQVDGIPVLSSTVPGPLRGALVFRVGQADETLRHAGVTHLVEHLSLSDLREQPYAYNGHVEGFRTTYWAEGSADELVEFFGRVCRGLSQLPLGRLSETSSILRAEEKSRPGSAVSSLLGWRFGPHGWGLSAYPELGLVEPDPDMVRAWAAERFTSANAACWISGPVPSGLSFPLAAGMRHGPPTVESPQALRTPAWVHDSQGAVGVSMVAPRSPLSWVLVRLLERLARARLRWESSLSYQVGARDLRLSDRVQHLVVFADGVSENMGRVWTGVLGVLDSMMGDGPSQQDLDEEREAIRRAMADPRWQLGFLERAVNDALLGTPLLTDNEILERLHAATPETFARLMRETFQTSLAMLPSQIAVVDVRFHPITNWSTDRVGGQEFQLQLPTDSIHRRTTRLFIGELGVSLSRGPGSLVTVRYSECVVLLSWSDGSRTLVGTDAFRLHVCPTDWVGGEEIPAMIDRRVPPGLIVSMGDRPRPDPNALTSAADRIPPPPAPAATPARPSRGRLLLRLGLLLLGGVAAITAIGVVFDLLFPGPK